MTVLPFDPVDEARANWERHGWGDAALGMAALTSVMRVHQILLARVDAVLRPRGLSFARYELLMLLTFSRRGELPLGKVGARLQVHPASITNAMRRLEGDGLVRRTPHPTDGRTTMAGITSHGRAVAREATAALNTEVFTDIGLDEADGKDLFELLRRVRSGAGDFE